MAYGGTDVYAVDAANGAIRWHISTDADQSESSVGLGLPCGANRLCLCRRDGSITAVALNDGHTLWHFELGHPIPSGGFFTPLAVVQDGNNIMVQTSQYLAMVDATSGALRWHRDFIANQVLALAGDYPFRDGIVYLSIQEGSNTAPMVIEAVDASTGKVKWQTKAAFSRTGYPYLLGPFLVNATGRVIVAYDITTGAVAWQAPLHLTNPPRGIKFLSVGLVPIAP